MYGVHKEERMTGNTYLRIYEDEVEEVLEVIYEELGVPMMISDESRLSDLEEEMDGNVLANLISKKFKINVGKGNRIFEIAKKIYDVRNK